MNAIFAMATRHRLMRLVAMAVVLVPLALLGACTQPMTTQPAPVVYQPAPAPAPVTTTTVVPKARG